MKEKLEKIRLSCLEQIESAKEQNVLEDVRVTFLGKKGELTSILKEVGKLSQEERPLVGKIVNEIREEIETKLQEKKEILEKEAILKQLENAEKFDFTVPVDEKLGSLHPITVVQREIEEIFRSMGFNVEEGNEVETEYNNFESVNVPAYHPARDMQDTFWLENGQLLKTQTSAAQNKIMRKYGAPLKAIFPGRCFRNEDLDNSHENTFFQLEGMVIDKEVSISNLIYVMKNIILEVCMVQASGNET